MTAQDSVALMGDCHLPRLGIFHPQRDISELIGTIDVVPFMSSDHICPKRLRAQNLESSRKSAP